jgi:hypothetical protein
MAPEEFLALWVDLQDPHHKLWIVGMNWETGVLWVQTQYKDGPIHDSERTEEEVRRHFVPSVLGAIVVIPEDRSVQ